MILLRFSRGVGLGGVIVRFATFSWCAHVGFKLEDGTVLDATPQDGVSIRQAVDDADTVYYRPLVSNRIADRAVSWAKEQIGKPYDWTAVIGNAIRRDWNKDDSKWFCSELVEAAFCKAHWPLVRDGKKFNRITPRDLLLSTRIFPVPAPQVIP